MMNTTMTLTTEGIFLINEFLRECHRGLNLYIKLIGDFSSDAYAENNSSPRDIEAPANQ